ncbi:MAG: NADH:ubiquinone oxidoreductase [Magnetococcales bacterium]|nr:NADH:ubiquinone oxidoreductase [Magnetococcales bacterium]MBF0150785.1 NADH:ubiquinone oxidoreductase [Magnetococcales bacterium]MBF0174006.1 NADH:ubiquinone oxidoreductase [Magnetococcales bacterium]MBF0348775.1 NADH:ubiquinone oxidoreductase [Magnetococcales bacterium]MBF0631885.1 NADH:ubiquinone oxidoreductase [Magnetococcales bacterium]
MATKPGLAMYWAASCGGCEIALVNLHEKILEVMEFFDFVFCPCLLDVKYQEVEAMADGAIAITLFNGAIRTTENIHMARLLRRKSRLLIAFGSCASEGCIPGLGNLASRQNLMDHIYRDSPTLETGNGPLPATVVDVAEGRLTLPEFLPEVSTLEQVVAVDYFIPGCPPESHQLWNVINSIIQGTPLPDRGAVLGGGRSTVCEECVRKRTEKKIHRLFRTYELIADPETCLLEQGLLCMGIATRDGCGGLCPKVNMPCTGCYGPPEGVLDQGAKMIAALGSMIDIEACREGNLEDWHRQVDAVLAAIPDLAGSLYTYSLAGSILGGKRTQ